MGSFLPLLSEAFKEVCAYDFSSACLEQAQDAYGYLENVSFQQADLTDETLTLGKTDFAFCCNVAISPSYTVREKIFHNIQRYLNPGGHLMLIVPSLESALYSGFRLFDWNLKAGYAPSNAIRCGFECDSVPTAKRYQGIIDIEKVPTKHYLKEELVVLLSDMQMTVKMVEKIEYDWSTEFSDPPSWMKSPYPWDWLVVAQKASS